MLIDCDTCKVRGQACGECVVNLLFGQAPPVSEPAGGQAGAGQAYAGQARGKQAAAGQARAGQAREEQASAGQASAGQAHAGQAGAGRPGQEQPDAERRAMQVLADAGFEVTVLSREDLRTPLRLVPVHRHGHHAA